jgi:hypothetical protein
MRNTRARLRKSERRIKDACTERERERRDRNAHETLGAVGEVADFKAHQPWV